MILVHLITVSGNFFFVAEKYMAHVEEHAKSMSGAVGLEMMPVNANSADRVNS